jgi:hypothetical protein
MAVVDRPRHQQVGLACRPRMDVLAPGGLAGQPEGGRAVPWRHRFRQTQEPATGESVSWLNSIDHDHIRTAGARAAAEMLRAGVPVYYMDDAIAPGEIIKEWPSGWREIVRIRAGEDEVLCAASRHQRVVVPEPARARLGLRHADRIDARHRIGTHADYRCIALALDVAGPPRDISERDDEHDDDDISHFAPQK